jgi:hypothetical protein
MFDGWQEDFAHRVDRVYQFGIRPSWSTLCSFRLLAGLRGIIKGSAVGHRWTVTGTTWKLETVRLAERIQAKNNAIREGLQPAPNRAVRNGTRGLAEVVFECKDLAARPSGTMRSA